MVWVEKSVQVVAAIGRRIDDRRDGAGLLKMLAGGDQKITRELADPAGLGDIEHARAAGEQHDDGKRIVARLDQQPHRRSARGRYVLDTRQRPPMRQRRQAA
jgi:hypothetical protein